MLGDGATLVSRRHGGWGSAAAVAVNLCGVNNVCPGSRRSLPGAGVEWRREREGGECWPAERDPATRVVFYICGGLSGAGLHPGRSSVFSAPGWCSLRSLGFGQK